MFAPLTRARPPITQHTTAGMAQSHTPLRSCKTVCRASTLCTPRPPNLRPRSLIRWVLKASTQLYRRMYLGALDVVGQDIKMFCAELFPHTHMPGLRLCLRRRPYLGHIPSLPSLVHPRRQSMPALLVNQLPSVCVYPADPTLTLFVSSQLVSSSTTL